MDVERALAELGLDRQFTNEELRRAYLRSVRKHPPERDPEGFQRVREANELLQRIGAGLWLRVRPAPLAATAPTEAESEPEPESESEPEPEVESETDVEEPSTATTPRRFDSKDVAELAEGLIDALDEPLGVSSALPPPDLCLLTILRLLAKGRPRLAHDLWKSFGRRAKTEAWGPRELTPEVAARWQLINEIMKLRDEVPRDMTRALARATLTGNYSTAVRSVRDARRDDRELGRYFAARAPTLYAAIWPLAFETAEKKYSPARSGFTGWGLVVALLACMRLCSGMSSPSSQRTVVTTPRTSDPVRDE